MCFAPPEAERPASRHLRWLRHWTTCTAAIWCRTPRSGKWCASAAACSYWTGFRARWGRTRPRSQLMEKENPALSAVVNYELPVAEIASRLSGRRTYEKCKAVFHVTRQPSRSEGICDECGGTAVPVLSPTRAARAGRRYWIARRNLRSHHECLGKTPRLAFVETGL